MKKKTNQHEGSDFQDFLKDQMEDSGFRQKYEKVKVSLAIGRTVRKVLEQDELSLRQLAKKMGSSLSQVQRLLNDENISFETFVKFLAATNRSATLTIKKKGRKGSSIQLDGGVAH